MNFDSSYFLIFSQVKFSLIYSVNHHLFKQLNNKLSRNFVMHTVND